MATALSGRCSAFRWVYSKCDASTPRRLLPRDTRLWSWPSSSTRPTAPPARTATARASCSAWPPWQESAPRRKRPGRQRRSRLPTKGPGAITSAAQRCRRLLAGEGHVVRDLAGALDRIDRAEPRTEPPSRRRGPGCPAGHRCRPRRTGTVPPHSGQQPARTGRRRCRRDCFRSPEGPCPIRSLPTSPGARRCVCRSAASPVRRRWPSAGGA